MRIGLIGAPGAGKDVIARYLVESRGFVRFAFADQIKKEYYAYSGHTEEEFKAARGTKLEEKIRSGLWEYSAKKTEGNASYFIDPVISASVNIQESVVISDVRTMMELWSIKANNFHPILILRNYKQELKGEIGPIGKVIPGTKIPIVQAIDFPIFWNDLDDLDETYAVLDNFYEELKTMDSDKSGEYNLL